VFRVTNKLIKGVSRSASIVLSYLLKNKQSETLLDAFRFVQKKRHIISPNIGFMEQLISFENDLINKQTIDLSIYVVDWCQTYIFEDIEREKLENEIFKFIKSCHNSKEICENISKINFL
jgi:hypothetical protein